MLSEQKRFIFVHIPKTAGNSLQSVLKAHSESQLITHGEDQDGADRFGVSHPRLPLRKHSALYVYRSLLDPETYGSYFKFTTVRNPWERAISLYFSPSKGRTTWNREAFEECIAGCRPMLDYLDSRRIPKLLARWIRPRVDVDFVIRFERLQQGFDEVCDRLGIERQSLPRLNRSARGDLSEYYDEELIRLVAQRFRCDIETFGYTFPAT